jgi:uncharacterized protein YeaO (DUF488 family)
MLSCRVLFLVRGPCREAWRVTTTSKFHSQRRRAKDVAPSTELRKWFNHERSKWQAFKKRYFDELKENPQAVAQLLELGTEQQVTLLFAAKDTEYNHAVALQEYIISKGKNGK